MTNLSPSIRVALVDDHEMILETLVRAVSRERDMSVVATASTVAEGIASIDSAGPDVVVFDYSLPDGDGATAAFQVSYLWPDVKVIILTGSDRDGAVFEAARAGCAGFLEKTRPASALVEMIRQVHAGVVQIPVERLQELPTPDQLVLHYQPVVDLTSRDVVGFEALVRWDHPNRGVLPPSDFLPLAEKTSLIVDIGETVRLAALRQAVEWKASRPDQPLTMSVNLSGRELHLTDLAARIDRVLGETGLQPDEVVIEVTETFFVEADSEHSRRLHEVKDLGVQIALDDFGTGFSSLSYLRRFPIDIIKLDRSFTVGLPGDAKAERLVDSIGHLASDMQAVTQAEGIETAEQASILLSLGWQLGQGYYFARPLDADSVMAAVLQPAGSE